MVFVVYGIVVAIDAGFVVACLVVWFGNSSTDDACCCSFVRVVIGCVVKSYMLHVQLLFEWLEQLGAIWQHKSVPLVLSEGEKLCRRLSVIHVSQLLETGPLGNSDIVEVVVAGQVGGIDGEEGGTIMKE